MNILAKKVFCVVFVIFVFFLIGCQQKEYTQHEDELASKIVERLSKVEKGGLIVFKRGKVEIIFSPSPAVGSKRHFVMVAKYPPEDPYRKMSFDSLKHKLSKVVFTDDQEYEKYARKFILQQIGIYETDD